MLLPASKLSVSIVTNTVRYAYSHMDLLAWVELYCEWLLLRKAADYSI
jgi:hypothetical protein